MLANMASKNIELQFLKKLQGGQMFTITNYLPTMDQTCCSSISLLKTRTGRAANKNIGLPGEDNHFFISSYKGRLKF